MSGILLVLGIVAVIAAMVWLYRKVLPQAMDGTFVGKHLQKLHDYFNFKKLYIESVLKFLFTLATVFCVVMGGVGLLQSVFDLLGGLVDMFAHYGGGYFPYVMGNFVLSVLGCAVFMVLGPVMLRLIYEGIMMFILLVKNVMEINGKLKGEKPVAETPVVEASAAEQPESIPAEE